MVILKLRRMLFFLAFVFFAKISCEHSTLEGSASVEDQSNNTAAVKNLGTSNANEIAVKQNVGEDNATSAGERSDSNFIDNHKRRLKFFTGQKIDVDKIIAFINAGNKLLNSQTNSEKVDKLTRAFSSLFKSDGMAAFYTFYGVMTNWWTVYDATAQIYRYNEMRILNRIDEANQPPDPLEDLQLTLNDANDNLAAAADFVNFLACNGFGNLDEIPPECFEQNNGDSETVVVQALNRKLQQGDSKINQDNNPNATDGTANHKSKTNNEVFKKRASLPVVKSGRRRAVNRKTSRRLSLKQRTVPFPSRKSHGSKRSFKNRQLSDTGAKLNTQRRPLASSKPLIKVPTVSFSSTLEGKIRNRNKRYIKPPYGIDRFVRYMTNANNALNSKTNNAALDAFVGAMNDILGSDGMTAYNNFYVLLGSFWTMVDAVANVVRFIENRIRRRKDMKKADLEPDPFIELQEQLEVVNSNVVDFADIIKVLACNFDGNFEDIPPQCFSQPSMRKKTTLSAATGTHSNLLNELEAKFKSYMVDYSAAIKKKPASQQYANKVPINQVNYPPPQRSTLSFHHSTTARPLSTDRSRNSNPNTQNSTSKTIVSSTEPQQYFYYTVNNGSMNTINHSNSSKSSSHVSETHRRTDPTTESSIWRPIPNYSTTQLPIQQHVSVPSVTHAYRGKDSLVLPTPWSIKKQSLDAIRQANVTTYSSRADDQALNKSINNRNPLNQSTSAAIVRENQHLVIANTNTTNGNQQGSILVEHTRRVQSPVEASRQIMRLLVDNDGKTTENAREPHFIVTHKSNVQVNAFHSRKSHGRKLNFKNQQVPHTGAKLNTQRHPFPFSKPQIKMPTVSLLSTVEGKIRNRNKRYINPPYGIDSFVKFMTSSNNALNSKTNNAALDGFVSAFNDLFVSDGMTAFNNFYTLIASFWTIVDAVANVVRFAENRVRTHVDRKKAELEPDPFVELQEQLEDANLNLAEFSDIIKVLSCNFDDNFENIPPECFSRPAKRKKTTLLAATDTHSNLLNELETKFTPYSVDHSATTKKTPVFQQHTKVPAINQVIYPPPQGSTLNSHHLTTARPLRTNQIPISNPTTQNSTPGTSVSSAEPQQYFYYTVNNGSMNTINHSNSSNSSSQVSETHRRTDPTTESSIWRPIPNYSTTQLPIQQHVSVPSVTQTNKEKDSLILPTPWFMKKQYLDAIRYNHTQQANVTSDNRRVNDQALDKTNNNWNPLNQNTSAAHVSVNHPLLIANAKTTNENKHQESILDAKHQASNNSNPLNQSTLATDLSKNQHLLIAKSNTTNKTKNQENILVEHTRRVQSPLEASRQITRLLIDKNEQTTENARKSIFIVAHKSNVRRLTP